MTAGRRARLLGVAVAAAGAAAGCGGGSGGAGGGGGGSGLVFPSHITISGAQALDGAFTDSEPDIHQSSCTDYVQHGLPPDGEYTLPGPVEGNSSVAGHDLAVALKIDGSRLHGAGSYTSADLRPKNSEGIAVDGDVFDLSAAPTLSITLRGDGTGSATFSGVQDGNGKAISGTLSWSCRPG